jgi:ATP-binding cassette, subfamily C, bacteriocin exporter
MAQFDTKQINKIKKSAQLQQDEMDCGAASLSTIIRYYGGSVSLSTIKEFSGTSKDGATFLGLKHAANYFGLTGEGYEGDLLSLMEINSPSILHFSFDTLQNHYVVCFGYDKDRFHLVDPAIGYLTMNKSDLEKMWVSQKLLLVELTEMFKKKEDVISEQRKWIIKLLLQNKQNLLLIVLMGSILTILNLTTAVFTQKLVDEILPKKELPLLLTTLTLWALVLTISIGLNFIRNNLLAQQSFVFNVTMLKDFFQRLLKQSKAFFDNKRVGDVIVRLNDTERIESTIREIFSNTMIDGMMLVAALTVVYLYSSSVALLIFILIPLYFVLGYLGNSELIKLQTKAMKSNSQIESEYISTINFIEEIKTAQKEDFFFKRVSKLYSKYQQSTFDLKDLSIKFSTSIKLLSIFMLVSVTVFSALQVFSNELLIGELFALFAITSIISESATNLSLINIKFQGARVALSRLFEFGQYQSKVKLIAHIEPISFLELSIQNISFRFIGHALLLRKVSINVKKGEIVSIFGKSGEGKSTLLQLVQKFYEVEDGIIMVNRINLRDIPNENWATLVATVPQTSNLMRGTLVENICLDDLTEKTERDVIAFCKQYGFDKYFSEFSNGYATYLGEDGTKISGGESQLVTIARALYQRPQLLLLDEVTSAMDSKTEDFVLNLLRKVKSEIGILLVTHKIRTSQISDRIYILKAGSISNYGTHQELLTFNNFYNDAYRSLLI